MNEATVRPATRAFPTQYEERDDDGALLGIEVRDEERQGFEVVQTLDGGDEPTVIGFYENESDARAVAAIVNG